MLMWLLTALKAAVLTVLAAVENLFRLCRGPAARKNRDDGRGGGRPANAEDKVSAVICDRGARPKAAKHVTTHNQIVEM
jgi:hypothetical protein